MSDDLVATLRVMIERLEDVRELVRLTGESLDRPYVEQGARELGVTDAWGEVTRG